jgi:thiaminase/transcriptional activator TenA
MYNAVSHLLPKAYEHRFIKGLINGNFPWLDFRFYIEQDFLYLADFSKALLRVSNKLTNPQHANMFKEFSEEALETKRDLHLKYLREPAPLRLFQSTRFSVKKIPPIIQYTNHLIITADTLSEAEGAASCAACYCLSNMVGKKMLEAPDYNPYSPYHLWNLSYSNPQSTAFTQAIIQIIDELGKQIVCPIQQKKVIDAFVKSVKYELFFWDSVCSNMEASNEFIPQKKFALR